MTPTDPNAANRPVDNAPYLSCQHAGMTIEGYARAAVQSYWRVPELKLGFDLGGQPCDLTIGLRYPYIAIEEQPATPAVVVTR